MIQGTMWHKAGDGNWKRCVATSRNGQGVTMCPVPNGRLHVTSHALAGLGGGSTGRTERLTKIEKPDAENNVYRVVGPHRTHYYDGETGRMISWKQLRKQELKIKRIRRAKVAGPSYDVVAINAETPEFLKQKFSEIDSAYGVKLDKYNHERAVETVQYAQTQATAWFLTGKDNTDIRERFANFSRAALYRTEVLKQSPKEAVDGLLKENNMGQFADVEKIPAPYRAEYRARSEAENKRRLQAEIDAVRESQKSEKERVQDSFIVQRY